MAGTMTTPAGRRPNETTAGARHAQHGITMDVPTMIAASTVAWCLVDVLHEPVGPFPGIPLSLPCFIRVGTGVDQSLGVQGWTTKRDTGLMGATRMSVWRALPSTMPVICSALAGVAGFRRTSEPGRGVPEVEVIERRPIKLALRG